MSNEWWELIPLAADPSKLPKLAIEVCERILDELDISHQYGYAGRGRIFATTCLVCRAWVPRSRYHLFKHVKVWSKGQVKEVSKLLYSIPALRTRVERLKVIGNNDERKDASWVGHVGYHLGPKLKTLQAIDTDSVNLSLMRLEDYQLWGAFNRAWLPGATKKLRFYDCDVTHINQLIRLAFVTKAEDLLVDWQSSSNQIGSAPSVPALSSGISLPLRQLDLHSPSHDLLLSTPWHTLASQSPSLSSVRIRCGDSLELSSPNGHLFLVSILHMFHCMQRHNDTTEFTLRNTGYPTIEMRTRPHDQSANADNTPSVARPRLHRELVLWDPHYGPSLRVSVYVFGMTLSSLEHAMVAADFTNERFHHVEIVCHLWLQSPPVEPLQSMDRVLSRLHISTHDAHVAITPKFREQSHEGSGCVLPWTGKHFPLLTEAVPNAFCDPDTGRPCNSHPKQASSDVEQAQEMVVEMSTEQGGVGTEAELVEQNVDVGVDVGVDLDLEGEEADPAGPSEGIQVTTTTGKRKAMEDPEAEEEEVRGKRRGTE